MLEHLNATDGYLAKIDQASSTAKAGMDALEAARHLYDMALDKHQEARKALYNAMSNYQQ